MAFAAMAERLDEIGAPVPFRRLARVRLESCRRVLIAADRIDIWPKRAKIAAA
jgi:hypothetical protein